jgi:hypothetical protein
MAIGDDFEVDTAGNITHTSGSTNYTVLELHRWLQDLADDEEAAGDDIMDITAPTPSERSTDNIITLNEPYNIDDDAAEQLYDGSITQAGGDTIYAGLVCVGSVEAGTELRITQDEANLTSHWSTGKNADAGQNILNRVLIKVRDNGADIDGRKCIVWARELGATGGDTYAEFSVTMGLGNNVAAIFTSDDLNNETADTTISGWSTIVNTEGYQLLDIAGDGSADEPYYSQWDRDIYTANQLYERTKWIQRRDTSETIHGINGALFRGITHEFTYGTSSTAPVEDNIASWGTYFAWDGESGSSPVVGDYVINTTSGGAAKVVWVDAAFTGGGAEGAIVVQRENFDDTWGDNDNFDIGSVGSGNDFDILDGTLAGATNNGGSGIILAHDDNTGSGTLWIQLISGTAPSSGYDLYERGVTAQDKGATTSGSTARTVSPEFFGTYTGSSIIGAFGIGILAADGIAADSFTTLTNSIVNPPNNQKFQVFGGVSVEDRILVTNAQTGDIDYDQMSLNTTLSAAAETQAVMTAGIPVDTPQDGVIRIELDSGIYKYVEYTSWTSATFTFTASENFSGDPATVNGGNPNVFIGYIDQACDADPQEVTIKYNADRTMFIRVRDGGTAGDSIPIKTFETTATFGSGGGSATVIRTSDA